MCLSGTVPARLVVGQQLATLLPHWRALGDTLGLESKVRNRALQFFATYQQEVKFAHISRR